VIRSGGDDDGPTDKREGKGPRILVAGAVRERELFHFLEVFCVIPLAHVERLLLRGILQVWVVEEVLRRR
jgi:hypothetical protein